MRARVYRPGSGLPGGVRGAADSNFACAVRSFAGLFPTRRLGGARSVYLDGRPVVDVWTGWADRRGTVPWSADTGAMAFSATRAWLPRSSIGLSTAGCLPKTSRSPSTA